MKHLILIGLLPSIVIVWFVLRRVPRNSAKSLSQHIATDASVITVARVMITLVAVMVAAWYFGWYTSVHRTFMVQAILLGAICLLAVLMAFVPHHQGRKAGILHVVFAWLYAWMLIPLVVTLALTSETTTARVTIGLLAAWQLCSACLYLLYPPVRRHFFQYELSFIGAFAVAMLIATYVG